MNNFIYYFFVLILGTWGVNASAQTFHDNTSQFSWPAPSPWVNDTLHAPKLAIVDFGAKYRVASPQIIEAGATLTVDGFLDIAGNTQLINNGTIIIKTTGVFDCSGSATFVNNGVLIINGALTGNGNFTLNNTGLLIGTGSIDLGNSTVLNTGSINGCTTAGSGCLGAYPFDLGSMPGGPSTDGLNNIYYVDSSDPIPATTCSDRLWVLADMNLTQNITTGGLILGKTLTINTTYAATICQEIANFGSVVVESGGSLVQTSTTNDNVGSGTYSINQAGGLLVNSDWNIWSSPITNALIVNSNVGAGTEVFGGTNPCDIYVIDGSTQAFTYDFDPLVLYTCFNLDGSINNSSVDFTGYVTSDGTADGFMDVGRGYWVTGNGSSTNKEFIGEVNNGTILEPIYFGAVQQFDLANINLVGNPYPSGLSASQFITDNAGVIDGTLYFYDQDINVWVTINSTGPSVPSVTDNIGVAQGFYVVSTSNANVEFNNAQRSITNDQFFKTESINEFSKIWIQISSPLKTKSSILIGSNENGTDGFDLGLDAQYMPNNPNLKLVSIIGEEDYSIQTIESLQNEVSKSVELTVFSAETGLHNFSSPKMENIPANVNVYLLDKYNRVKHDMSFGNYVVFLEGNVEYSNRFELVFENQGIDIATGINEINSNDISLISDESGYSLKSEEGITGDIQVIDVTGKVVWTANNVQSNSVNINLNGLSSGIYLINVMNNNERVYSNKVIKP